ncbi:TIGR03016 family PEP-CTERM system-associated outer membrane protein [Azoarcus sp. L1K30]|nr:TIGR03016 family PEP-CTERM system-associated outer membrane protein [Azoarcus sp. L1K30]
MVRKPVLKQPDRCAVPTRLLAIVLGVAGSCGAFAQGVVLTPSLQTQLTWTDNVDASSAKESDWIAEVSPGLALSRDSGRFSGTLNARLRNVMYASDASRNTSYVDLQGQGEIEAAENMLFVELAANISRNNLSSFSGRSGNDNLSVAATNETRTWSLGPRLEFRLGDNARGTVRYRSTWLSSGSSQVSDQRQGLLTAQLSDPAAGSLLGWGLDYSQNTSEYDDSTTRNVTQETARATLYMNVTPQFRMRAIGGHESNDYASAQREGGSIYGGGFDWNPTERTSISGTTEERIFGRGYNFSLKHRAQRSTWDLSYVRDISSSLQTLSGGIFQDPLFLAFYNDPAMIAALPDSAQREAFVRLLLGYPATGGTGEVVSNAHFLSKSLRGAFSLIGVRNSFSMSFMRTDRARLSSLTGLSAQDDFALSDTVKTSSVTLSFNHKLSGTSSLNTAVTRSRSQGASGTGLDTRRTTATVGVTTQLGARTNAGLAYRYQRSDGSSALSDFTENAVTASLGMTF